MTATSIMTEAQADFRIATQRLNLENNPGKRLCKIDYLKTPEADGMVSVMIFHDGQPVGKLAWDGHDKCLRCGESVK